MHNLLEHTRRHDITFHRNGTIRITAPLARTLALRPGDSINIAVHDGEYLLHVIRHDNPVGRHEAQCYRSKRGGGENYCANSVRLCRLLLTAVGCKAPKISFSVGETTMIAGKIYVPIITHMPL